MSIQRLSAWGGCELIADTNTRTGKDYNAFIVQEDTVIAALSSAGSPATKNYLTLIGLSGKTLKAGALIVAPLNEVFDTIKLTSGSVIAYR